MLNLASLTRSSLQILGKTQTSFFFISEFLVKSPINNNYHNSKTCDDIDMKRGSLTKLNKRNTATSKKKDDVFMSVNYDFIIICPIYSRFRAIWTPDSECMVHNS